MSDQSGWVTKILTTSGREIASTVFTLTEEQLAKAEEGLIAFAQYSPDDTGQLNFPTPAGWVVVPIRSIEAIALERVPAGSGGPCT